MMERHGQGEAVSAPGTDSVEALAASVRQSVQGKLAGGVPLLAEPVRL